MAFANKSNSLTSIPAGSRIKISLEDGFEETGILKAATNDFVRIIPDDLDFPLTFQCYEIEAVTLLAKGIHDSVSSESQAQEAFPDVSAVPGPESGHLGQRPASKKGNGKKGKILPSAPPDNAKSKRDITPLLTKNAKLPLKYWTAGWILTDIEDLAWRKITLDAQEIFPLTLRTYIDRHRGYVISEVGDFLMDLVPMSSKNFNKKNLKIPFGAKLDYTNEINDRDSYLVIRARSRIGRDCDLFPFLPGFLGSYPPEKLQPAERPA